MFGFIADILTSIASILLPVFFSYKALRTSDPAVLAPWLMYWTTLSLFLLVESQLYFILAWVPFYSWLRLGLYLYLVLPGQQGSVYLYRAYVHPFLEEHERAIDRMIADAHAKAKAAGMDAVTRAIEYVRVQVLGQPPRAPSPPPSRAASGANYATHLFNRFAMPSARDGIAAAGTSDLFSLLGKALQQTAYPDTASAPRDVQAMELAASGTLIPPHLEGVEREDFVNVQRDRLRTLLRAFDDEAIGYAAGGGGVGDFAAPVPASPSRSPRLGSSGSSHHRKTYLTPESGHMHKSRSESEFEDLAYETMPDPEQFMPRAGGSGSGRKSERPKGPTSRNSAGWSNWIWGNYGEEDSVLNAKKDI